MTTPVSKPSGKRRSAASPGSAANSTSSRTPRRYVPQKGRQAEVASGIRMIFNVPDRSPAEQYLAKMVQKYAKTASRLADWMEKNIPEGLTVFSFQADHRCCLRTTNGLERVNKEIHRCTQVVSFFPNEASCLRLISAALMEIDEEWQIGKVYLSMFNSQGSLKIQLGRLTHPTEKALHNP